MNAAQSSLLRHITQVLNLEAHDRDVCGGGRGSEALDTHMLQIMGHLDRGPYAAQ